MEVLRSGGVPPPDANMLELDKVMDVYKRREAELSLELCDVFTEELIELHHGQGLDIYWRDNAVCPSLEEYDAMVLKKTGGLFRLALKVMLVMSPRLLLQAAVPPPPCPKESAQEHTQRLPSQLMSLVNSIGVFFQTMDDYQNVASDVYHKNKSYCEDLTEGKFSYPVIHCIQEQQRQGGEKTLLHILKQRTTDVDVKRYCVELMKRMGSLEACQKRCLALKKDIADAAEQIGEPQGAAALARCFERLNALM
jgi:geranylgeranyl diphosphate synthase type 3